MDPKILSHLKGRIDSLVKAHAWLLKNEPCGDDGHIDHLLAAIHDFEQLLRFLGDPTARLVFEDEIGGLHIAETEPPPRARVVIGCRWYNEIGLIVCQTKADPDNEAVPAMYGLVFEPDGDPIFFSRRELEFIETDP
jgi:hypothetical protein